MGAQVDLFDARQLRRWNLSLWTLYRWYFIAAIAALVAQGALIAGLLVARARQRRAEAEARRQRDDLAHVLRITTLGELTTSLAHDISQPLTAILANAQAASRLMKGARPSDVMDVAEALADIETAARHASLVIDRLRTLFRKERVKHVAVDVKALIEAAVRLLHAAMLIGRIDIQLVHAEVLPAVSGDPVQLEQVLLNVLMNACEAIGASGNGPRAIMIRSRQHPPGRVLVEVTDTGVGVKQADLEHIFKHFVGTKPNGLGMGLAISRSIISAHGGRIWASANTGRGLTVHIELPCLSDSPSEGTAAEVA